MNEERLIRGRSGLEKLRATVEKMDDDPTYRPPRKKNVVDVLFVILLTICFLTLAYGMYSMGVRRGRIEAIQHANQTGERR